MATNTATIESLSELSRETDRLTIAIQKGFNPDSSKEHRDLCEQLASLSLLLGKSLNSLQSTQVPFLVAEEAASSEDTDSEQAESDADDSLIGHEEAAANDTTLDALIAFVPELSDHASERAVLDYLLNDLKGHFGSRLSPAVKLKLYDLVDLGRGKIYSNSADLPGNKYNWKLKFTYLLGGRTTAVPIESPLFAIDNMFVDMARVPGNHRQGKFWIRMGLLTRDHSNAVVQSFTEYFTRQTGWSVWSGMFRSLGRGRKSFTVSMDHVNQPPFCIFMDPHTDENGQIIPGQYDERVLGTVASVIEEGLVDPTLHRCTGFFTSTFNLCAEDTDVDSINELKGTHEGGRLNMHLRRLYVYGRV